MKYVAALVGCLVLFFAAAAPAILRTVQAEAPSTQPARSRPDRSCLGPLEFSGDYIGPAGEAEVHPASGTESADLFREDARGRP